MDAQIFLALYDYNAWANRRVWDCVQHVDDEQFARAIDHSLGSVQNQIAHIMEVEYWWFRFLSTGEPDFASEDDLATRETIRAKWDEAEGIIHDYVAALTADELLRKVKPPFWAADEPALHVYEALFQVALHSTDHRAQTLAALHQLGAPTTPQDYLFFKFDSAGVSWSNE